MKRAIMVWGASSGAGKSLLATALCRWAARQGLDVAPFKAQNMSNNARVVPADSAATGSAGELCEIGSAQYFQAIAARQRPQVDMNPVLLKPERDTTSQVVVQGRVNAALGLMPWRERSAPLAAAARQSLERLAGRHEVIVMEGAGSPAEINLAPHDYVNLGAARWAQELGAFKSVMVADIDRGGAFAHLYGSWALLPDDLRPTLCGHVLNRFRGDAALLAPGPAQLQTLTRVPVLGVLPMVYDHGLPDEDAVHHAMSQASDGPRIAVIAWPHGSNLDEFQPLAAASRLRWVRSPAELECGCDCIVLPGSKQVSGDLVWLRRQGLDAAITAHARRGGSVLGICGGMQMLGQWLHDPDGMDGEPHAPLPGLGLLPLSTRYAAPKRLRLACARFDALHAPWAALSGLSWPAYEIRCGRTMAVSAEATPALWDAEGQVIGWQGREPMAAVLGIAAHGLFEDAHLLRALFGVQVRTLDDTFERLADLIEHHLSVANLRALFQL